VKPHHDHASLHAFTVALPWSRSCDVAKSRRPLGGAPGPAAQPPRPHGGCPRLPRGGSGLPASSRSEARLGGASRAPSPASTGCPLEVQSRSDRAESFRGDGFLREANGARSVRPAPGWPSPGASLACASASRSPAKVEHGLLSSPLFLCRAVEMTRGGCTVAGRGAPRSPAATGAAARCGSRSSTTRPPRPGRRSAAPRRGLGRDGSAPRRSLPGVPDTRSPHARACRCGPSRRESEMLTSLPPAALGKGRAPHETLFEEGDVE